MMASRRKFIIPSGLVSLVQNSICSSPNSSSRSCESLDVSAWSLTGEEAGRSASLALDMSLKAAKYREMRALVRGSDSWSLPSGGTLLREIRGEGGRGCCHES